jgi:hypothetical protein
MALKAFMFSFLCLELRLEFLHRFGMDVVEVSGAVVGISEIALCSDYPCLFHFSVCDGKDARYGEEESRNG